MTELLVLHHGDSGRTAVMARAVAAGIAGVPSCAARLRYVGPGSAENRATPADVEECAGLALGTPVHFASVSTPVREFFDGLTDLWMRRALAGRPATVFCAAGSGGGRETAILAAWSLLASHGMVIMPLGFHPEMANLSVAHGASPFGAGTVAGPGDRPTGQELALARRQGEALGLLALALER